MASQGQLSRGGWGGVLLGILGGGGGGGGVRNGSPGLQNSYPFHSQYF